MLDLPVSFSLPRRSSSRCSEPDALSGIRQSVFFCWIGIKLSSRFAGHKIALEYIGRSCRFLFFPDGGRSGLSA